MFGIYTDHFPLESSLLVEAALLSVLFVLSRLLFFFFLVELLDVFIIIPV